jgi:hypothetical protein
MDPGAFLSAILVGVGVILISAALDLVWARTIPYRLIYYGIRVPGVIVHEFTHILGCLVTGAKVQDVVLFSDKGGSVAYSRPAIPYIGDVIISIAPLFGIPLVLVGITWVFGTYLGCSFPPPPPYIDSLAALQELSGNIFGVFYQNLVARFNPWFLLYLYLTVSLVLSLAPSGQDIRNAAIGIAIIALFGFLIVWYDVPLLVDGLLFVTRIIGTGLALGLMSGLIALVVSIPLVVVYLRR